MSRPSLSYDSLKLLDLHADLVFPTFMGGESNPPLMIGELVCQEMARLEILFITCKYQERQWELVFSALLTGDGVVQAAHLDCKISSIVPVCIGTFEVSDLRDSVKHLMGRKSRVSLVTRTGEMGFEVPNVDSMMLTF